MKIIRECPIEKTPRAMQLAGLFDLPDEKVSHLEWDVTLPLDEQPWSVGLIVGPSGSGKSTVAREIFGDSVSKSFEWSDSKSVVDSFPASMGIKDITLLLSSVGFSSPPSWLRPYRVLSNGERFRVDMARALSEAGDKMVVVDEFSSVIDRTVAKIGSAAVAKTVRRRGGRFVAVSCHYDIEEWLDPEWVLDMATQKFAWRLPQGRPVIDLQIVRAKASQCWPIFRGHHYLTATLNPTATCFVGFWNDQPIALSAWMPFIGRLSHGQGKRASRTVVLPDFQGCSVGLKMLTYCASLWKGLGYRPFGTTSHPALIAARQNHPDWIMTRAPGFTGRDNDPSLNKSRAKRRFSASFEFIGEPMAVSEADRLLNRCWAV